MTPTILTAILTLLVCSASPCTTTTAKETFTQQTSQRSCDLTQGYFTRFPDKTPGFALNAFKYVAAPGDIFVVTCSKQ